jgi:hypothetical protein
MLLLTIANDRSIGKTLKVVAEKSSMQITPAQLRSLLNGQRSFRVVSMMPPWRSIQACADRKVQAGVPLDLQVLALDPDENDQVQVAPNYLNVLAGVPQDLAVGLLG